MAKPAEIEAIRRAVRAHHGGLETDRGILAYWRCISADCRREMLEAVASETPAAEAETPPRGRRKGNDA